MNFTWNSCDFHEKIIQFFRTMYMYWFFAWFSYEFRIIFAWKGIRMKIMRVRIKHSQTFYHIKTVNTFKNWVIDKFMSSVSQFTHVTSPSFSHSSGPPNRKGWTSSCRSSLSSCLILASRFLLSSLSLASSDVDSNSANFFMANSLVLLIWSIKLPDHAKMFCNFSRVGNEDKSKDPYAFLSVWVLQSLFWVPPLIFLHGQFPLLAI